MSGTRVMSGSGAQPAAWRRVLVLGGIRSGKSEYAEGLVAAAETVRYVATARRIAGDDEWNTRIDAHRLRRPAGWTTTEVGGHPLALLDFLAAAAEDDTIVVEDLGTWVGDLMESTGPEELSATLELFAATVRGCTARLVLVSPEVGLSVVPASAAARTFADALGATNRAIAAACDRVTLVIAGNAVPVKGGL